MSLNRATLIGNVGQDPVIKTLENGTKVAQFTLATTEKGYTLQNGTVVPDRTEWHNVVAWNGLAKVAEGWIRKGTQIYVEGKITTRSWEKDSVKMYRTEIVAENIQLLGGKPSQQDQPQQVAPVQQQTATQQMQAAFPNVQQPFGSGANNGSDLPF